MTSEWIVCDNNSTYCIKDCVFFHWPTLVVVEECSSKIFDIRNCISEDCSGYKCIRPKGLERSRSGRGVYHITACRE